MKKTEVVTIRITEETKKRIEERAQKYKWSNAQTISEILDAYFGEKTEGYNSDYDRVPCNYKIHKHYEECIIMLSEALKITTGQALEIIIDFYERMYPIDFIKP